MSLQLQAITFAYPGSSQPLFQDLSLSFAPGWTGVLGPNGAGKTSLLHLALGKLRPQKGRVLGGQHCLYLAQRVDDPPEAMPALLQRPDALAGRLVSLLGLQPDWLERWPSLSPGEKKRSQVATALWQEPEVLLLDEPSNHLDAPSKELLLPLFRQFKGVGLLVSHDRAWLAGLCRSLVWIEPGRQPVWAQDWEQMLWERQQQAQAAQDQAQELNAQRQRLQAQSGRFRDQSNRSHQLRSKKGLSKKDHDGKAKINLARNSGKDGQAGRRLNQLQGRLAQVETKRKAIHFKRDFRGEVAQKGAKAKADLLLSLPAQSLPLGQGRSLHCPALTLLPNHRIGLTGPNGAGKSTLLGQIIQQWPWPAQRLLCLPQELSQSESIRLLQQIRALPPDQKGALFSLVGRLGSDPGAILQSPLPSPGEARKLMIAEGLLKEPWLILLDEPTNHLDLPSVLALEQALAGTQAALLLVSHDQAFLQSLCHSFWRIKQDRLCLDE